MRREAARRPDATEKEGRDGEEGSYRQNNGPFFSWSQRSPPTPGKSTLYVLRPPVLLLWRNLVPVSGCPLLGVVRVRSEVTRLSGTTSYLHSGASVANPRQGIPITHFFFLFFFHRCELLFVCCYDWAWSSSKNVPRVKCPSKDVTASWNMAMGTKIEGS